MNSRKYRNAPGLAMEVKESRHGTQSAYLGFLTLLSAKIAAFNMGMLINYLFGRSTVSILRPFGSCASSVWQGGGFLDRVLGRSVYDPSETGVGVLFTRSLRIRRPIVDSTVSRRPFTWTVSPELGIFPSSR